MTTIQMTTGNVQQNGNFQLPPPSTVPTAVANGIATVAPEDVRIAIKQGWNVMAGQFWPGAEMVRMLPPLNAPGVDQTRYLPDGNEADVTGGFAIVSIAMVGPLKSLGWTEVSPIPLLQNASATSNAVSWPGGPGLFYVGTALTYSGTPPAVASKLNGATVALQYSPDGGVTWLNVSALTNVSGLGGWYQFGMSGPCLLRAQISGGSPTGVYACVIPGSFYP